MKLNPIGSNKTVVALDNGTEVFFSYKTPVAAFVPGRGYVRTDRKWSVTTSKHINQWLNGTAEIVPQAYLDALV